MAALGGRPASLRTWSQPRAEIIIKSAKGGELSARVATAGSCAGSLPRVLFLSSSAASRVTSPSCAVSVSGALRHGAP